MQEEIFYNKSRSGTTVTFFNTQLQPEEENQYPAYITLSNTNQPLSVTTFDGEIKWALNNQNYNVQAEEFGLQTITGTAFFQTFDFVLSDQRKQLLQSQFLQQMNAQFSGLSTSYVFFENREVDDLFVTVKLEQTSDHLHTLSIYNNLRNSFPAQASDTGTVFGRLVAIQKLKDRSGNNIKIPLRNVPVGVFNPSSIFTDATSVDENGNRISLNIVEGSVSEDYFNDESFNYDVENLLVNGSQFTTVPDHYKYMTYTNDQGEFVIHNVPVGTQTLIFEVDLFKQGLTKDEINLNFFPFPPDPEPNPDNVPSLFFRQFPIDVVPTWGDFQTGYTEVNISANIDLRKWATFFVTPVKFDEDQNDIEFLQSRGLFEPIKIQIRDMSAENYPIRNIEMVEVPDIRNREFNQQLNWKNEIKQLKNQVEIRRKGYQAFKVPANAYDPNGFRTDPEGNPTDQRGVWLAAYQFKMFYDSPNTLFRATGQRSVWTGEEFVQRDHFHLNYNYEEYNQSNASAQSAGLGDFPYERPWDHLYPEPYSIPALPSIENPNFTVDDTSDAHVLEAPRYLDGDRIGHPFVPEEFTDDGFGGGTGGYGVQYDQDAEVWFTTDFSRLIAKNTLYRYENRGYLLEEYANGYRPNDDNFVVQPGVSNVVNGEKYQRVECGYGYFLKPQGWARIATYPWYGSAEATFQKDLIYSNEFASISETTGGGVIVNRGKDNSMIVSSELAGQKVSLNLGGTSPQSVQGGAFDIYRVVNSNPNENLNPLTLGEKRTFVRTNFSYVRLQNAYSTGEVFNETKWRHGSQQEDFRIHGEDYKPLVPTQSSLYIKNRGAKQSQIKVIGGLDFTLGPGQEITKTMRELGIDEWKGLQIDFEANSEFDYVNRYYKKAKYDIHFRNFPFSKNNNSPTNIKLERDYTINYREFISNSPSQTIKNYYLISVSSVKIKTNALGKQKCNGNFFSYTPWKAIKYNGIYCDAYKTKRHIYSYWDDSPLSSFTCDDGGPEMYFLAL